MKKLLSVLIVVFFIVSVSLALPLKKQKQSSKERVIIPKEVGVVFDNTVATRTPRLDIPLNFIEYLFFPAQQNHLHTIFLFKMKNKDMDFKEVPQAPVEKKEIEQETSQNLVADMNAFLRFYRLEDKKVKEIFKEVYIPFQVSIKKDEFNPEEENFYSFGYPLPPGKYLLGCAVTSIDLTKIGTFYYEFELPNPLKIEKELILSPIVFLKSIKRLPTVETMPTMHKNSFRYSVLEIVPRLELTFSKAEQPDLFYYIFGARQNPETNKFEIEISYKIYKGDEAVIKFKPTVFEFPLISHPLPLKRQDKFIEPGDYTLEIKILDKVTNSTVTKKINIKNT